MPNGQADRAYKTLKQRILVGELTFGAPMSRRKLAAELDMSFGSVSEAMLRLERDGLIESLPRVGTRVVVPSVEKVQDHFIIREALESQAARLFCEKASSDERKELTAMAEELDRLDEEGQLCSEDPEVFLGSQSYHLCLHLRVAQYAGSPTLRQMIEQNHILLFTWLFRDQVAPNPPHWHSELAHVLVARDPLAADAAMRRHVRNGVAKLLEGLTSAEVASRFRRHEYEKRRK